MEYQTTLTIDDVLTDVEEWLLKQNLLPSINDIGGLTCEDKTLYHQIEDLIKQDHAYWANCSKWSLYDHAKTLINK
jgi:hypothetical protein